MLRNSPMEAVGFCIHTWSLLAWPGKALVPGQGWRHRQSWGTFVSVSLPPPSHYPDGEKQYRYTNLVHCEHLLHNRVVQIIILVCDLHGWNTNVTPGPIFLYCFVAIILASSECAHCSLAKMNVYTSSSHVSVLTLFPLKCSNLGGYFSASTCLKPLSALPVRNKTVASMTLTEIKLKATEKDRQMS